jgi:hydroxymethylbilane synthase
VHAERAVARALGGSCSMPLAAFAQREATAASRCTRRSGDAAVRRRSSRNLRDARHAAAAAAPCERAALADVAAAEALGARVAAALLAPAARPTCPPGWNA